MQGSELLGWEAQKSPGSSGVTVSGVMPGTWTHVIFLSGISTVSNLALHPEDLHPIFQNVLS